MFNSFTSLTPYQGSLVFSLAVSGVPVNGDLKLPSCHTPDAGVLEGKGSTIFDLQAKGELFFQTSSSSPAKFGVVHLPPLILRDRLADVAPIISLSLPSISMTFTSNETLAISVLLHKLRAFYCAGRPTVNLHELGLRKLTDRVVKVPSCFQLEVLSKQVTAANFDAFCAAKRPNTAGSSHAVDQRRGVDRVSTTTPVAFLNAKSAPFADAILLLGDFVLLIQEKQSVTARCKRLEGLAPGTVKGYSSVSDEYDKVARAVKDMPLGFLYITDEDFDDNNETAPANCAVYGYDAHNDVLGKTVAVLRQFALVEDAAKEVDCNFNVARASTVLVVADSPQKYRKSSE
jgi:hypothetical protein